MPEYVKVARLAIPVGWRVIVVSDLFLGAKRTEASGTASVKLASALERVEGPGALVVAGNAFDLLVPPGGNPAAALGAHRELQQALARLLGGGPQPTGHPAARQPRSGDPLRLGHERGRRGCRVRGCSRGAVCRWRRRPGRDRSASSPGGDSTSATPSSTRPIRGETPLGHHAVAEILPALAGSTSPWLAGIDRLIDPSGLPRFVASRLTYRRVVRWLWWLLVPIAAALFSRLPDYWLFGVPKKLEPFSSRILGLGLTLAVEVIVAGLVLVLVNHRVWHSAGRSLLGPTRAPCERQGPRSIATDPGRGRCRPGDRPYAPARARAGRHGLLRELRRVRRSRGRAGFAPRPASGLRRIFSRSPGSRSRRGRRCMRGSFSPVTTFARDRAGAIRGRAPGARHRRA